MSAKNTNLGRGLRAVMARDVLTITDVARILRIGRPAMTNLTNGRACMSFKTAFRLEEVFGFDADGMLKDQLFEQIERARSRYKKPRPEAGILVARSKARKWATR